jgi:hypothetical protein
MLVSTLYGVSTIGMMRLNGAKTAGQADICCNLSSKDRAIMVQDALFVNSLHRH